MARLRIVGSKQTSRGLLVCHLLKTLERVRKSQWSMRQELQHDDGTNCTAEARTQTAAYEKVRSAIRGLAGRGLDHNAIRNLQAFENALECRGTGGIMAQLEKMLKEGRADLELPDADLAKHARLADLRYPHEWYPMARTLQRHIHLHIGPTNSGKTYHALKRLEEAKSGIYAGPLRLLAHEVYVRFNAQGRSCNLVTGDEIIQKESVGELLSSCTVEMVPLTRTVDVAVLDEIQMIGNEQRGWAWTQVLLGVQAKELHVCGEERVLPLIQKLAAAMGERLTIHRYNRLSPLRTSRNSLHRTLKHLRKGDCLVAFSRQSLHNLKEQIEREKGKLVAIIYGALPPEIRAEQARLFNDPSNDYDFLVASDAIGLGLNLNIKRVIFSTLRKLEGATRRIKALEASAVKQIGGRAGRFRIAPLSSICDQRTEWPESGLEANPRVERPQLSQSVGLVTTLQPQDLPYMQCAMEATVRPIQKAVVKPPDDVVARFARCFRPDVPLSYVLHRFVQLTQMNPLFQMGSLIEDYQAADVVSDVPGLSIEQCITFGHAPANFRDERITGVAREIASRIAGQKRTSILDLESLALEILDAPTRTDREYLIDLEELYSVLVLYIWLSYRFAGVLSGQALAFHAKELVRKRMSKYLVSTILERRTSGSLTKSTDRDETMPSKEIASVLNGEDTLESGALAEICGNRAGSTIRKHLSYGLGNETSKGRKDLKSNSSWAARGRFRAALPAAETGPHGPPP